MTTNENNNTAGSGSGGSHCSHDAIQQAWHDYHGPIHTDEGDGYVPSMPPTFMRGFVDGFQHAEKLMRGALHGHPGSELWGEHGLIAATMRCVEEVQKELPIVGDVVNVEKYGIIHGVVTSYEQCDDDCCIVAKDGAEWVCHKRDIISANDQGDLRCEQRLVRLEPCERPFVQYIGSAEYEPSGMRAMGVDGAEYIAIDAGIIWEGWLAKRNKGEPWQAQRLLTDDDRKQILQANAKGDSQSPPPCYAPEVPFAHETGMIYSLRQNGWRKGQPQMENDVWINIQSRTISQEQRDAIAQVIVDALNDAFPSHNDKDTHEGQSET